MNAFRKFRLLALVGLVAVLVVGLAGTSADAGCYSYGYSTYYTPSCHFAPVYNTCHYPTWYVQPHYLNSCYNVFPATYLP